MERGMSEVLEGAVCGIDGCAPTALDHFGTASNATATLAIEVISDAICAGAGLPSGAWIARSRHSRRTSHLPSPGDPSNSRCPRPEWTGAPTARPSSGLGSTPRRSTRRSPRAGRSEGLVFNHDKMERTPNTIDAHRLTWLAGQQAKQRDVVEGLFAAYFNEGRDIGDPTVLADVGASAGLKRARILAMLASDEGQAEVRSELQRALNLRVSGVPTVLVDGVPLFSGAIRAELMEAELRKAAGLVRS